MTVSAPRYLYHAGMEFYSCVLAARDAALESPVPRGVSLDHTPALLLYCVCVGEHGVEMYSLPSRLWGSVLARSIVWRRE